MEPPSLPNESLFSPEPIRRCRRSFSECRLFSAFVPVARCVAHRILFTGFEISGSSSANGGCRLGLALFELMAARRTAEIRGCCNGRPQPERPLCCRSRQCACRAESGGRRGRCAVQPWAERRVVVLRRGCECTGGKAAMTNQGRGRAYADIMGPPGTRVMSSASQQHQNSNTVWAQRAWVGVRGLPVCAAGFVRRSSGSRVAGVSGVVKPMCGNRGKWHWRMPGDSQNVSFADCTSARCLQRIRPECCGVYTFPPRASCTRPTAPAKMLFRPCRAE